MLLMSALHPQRFNAHDSISQCGVSWSLLNPLPEGGGWDVGCTQAGYVSCVLLPFMWSHGVTLTVVT